MPPFIEKWVNTEKENPDWKATCEAMNDRTLEREKWFIKWLIKKNKWNRILDSDLSVFDFGVMVS